MNKKLFKIFFGCFFVFLCVLFLSCNSQTQKENKEEILKAVKNEIMSSLPLEITEDSELLSFTLSSRGVEITYKSNNEEVLSSNGVVHFPKTDTIVTLDVTFSIISNGVEMVDNGSTIIIVRSGKTDETKFNEIKEDIIKSIPSVVRGNINLKTTSLYSSSIRYESSNQLVLSNEGIAGIDLYKEDVSIDVYVKIGEKEFLPFTINIIVSTREVDDSIEQKLAEIEMEVLDSIEFGIVKEDITLLTSSLYNSTIRYESSDETILSSAGVVGSEVKNKSVTLSFYIMLEGNEYGPFQIIIMVNTYVATNDNVYYEDISDNLSGSALKQALRTLITTTQTRATSYDEIKTITAKTDADPEKPGNIILFYSRVSVSAKWDGGSTWNREHIWPRSKSWFQYDGAGSDIHHLRPTNPSINSSRGNKAYANTASSTSYLPDDVVKGDIARIVFYLLTRYPESDSYPISNVATSMKMLLEWNELDPVDNLEIVRNEECFKFQGNRNPFIDYPDYANLIWGSIDLNIHEPFERFVHINIVLINDIKIDKKKEWL